MRTLRELLTPREFEVATLTHLGWSNPDIAAELGVVDGTVKHFLTRIFEKCGCDNRTMLAVRYERDKRAEELRLADAIALEVAGGSEERKP